MTSTPCASSYRRRRRPAAQRQRKQSDGSGDGRTGGDGSRSGTRTL